MVIETERLLLRRLTIDDLDEVVAFQANPDIIRFTGTFDRVHALDWLRRVDQNWRERGYGRIAITDRSSGVLLGRTGTMYLQQFDEIELGWTLRREAWGRGYATEAAGACVEWMFRDFELAYLISLIEPGNYRSIQVAARLRMTPLRSEVFLDRPTIVHSIDRDRWRTMWRRDSQSRSSSPSLGLPQQS
jgi:RimJ/RimL family protein N-acetyltransferase